MVTLARSIDPATGDRVMDRARRTWTRARSPELAVVQNVLSTTKGSAARDPEYGVVRVDNAAPNASAVWRQNVLVALARWIRSGFLRDVDVTSEVRALPTGGSALAYVIRFKGRDGLVQTYPGTTQ